MDISTALINDLSDLCSDLESCAVTAIDAVGALSRDLHLAVRSHLGWQLILPPIALTVFAPGVVRSDIGASLHLPLDALNGSTQLGRPDPEAAPRGGAVTFYASKPGAFVDLAADVSYALEVTDPDARRTNQTVPASGIRLDQDLEPTTLTSGLVGAAVVSTVNRAIGVLIARGYEPDQAQDELSRRATHAGVGVLVSAAQLLRTCSSNTPNRFGGP